MTTTEIIGAVNHLQQILAAYQELTSLPDCNTCAAKRGCVYAPKPGQMTRINCFAYEPKGGGQE